MPRTCTVCAHTDRHAIEKALVAGTPNRRIATQHGLSEAAVRRHAAEHLPVALVTAAGAKEVRQALDVLQQLKTINAAALTVLRDARAAQDGDLALKAVDRIQRPHPAADRATGEVARRPRRAPGHQCARHPGMAAVAWAARRGARALPRGPRGRGGGARMLTPERGQHLRPALFPAPLRPLDTSVLRAAGHPGRPPAQRREVVVDQLERDGERPVALRPALPLRADPQRGDPRPQRWRRLRRDGGNHTIPFCVVSSGQSARPRHGAR